jgi:hypothetical protein
MEFILSPSRLAFSSRAAREEFYAHHGLSILSLHVVVDETKPMIVTDTFRLDVAVCLLRAN